MHDSDRSLVDLNRAGVPLMELVFEPDLVDGEEAAALIKELITILQRIGTCSCKMEGTLTASLDCSLTIILTLTPKMSFCRGGFEGGRQRVYTQRGRSPGH